MIYVIREQEEDGSWSPFVKVGMVVGDKESHVRARLNRHQVGNPRRLVVVGMCSGGRAEEKELHERFKRYRVKRKAVREWLRVEGVLAEWMEIVKCESIQKPRQKRPPVPKRCRHCDSLDHTKGKCHVRKTESQALRQAERDRKAAERRDVRLKREAERLAEIKAERRASVRFDPFEWRGRVRGPDVDRGQVVRPGIMDPYRLVADRHLGRRA